MSQDFKRADRVAERIRAELMDLLLRGAVGDSRTHGALVSGVRVTDDLRQARIYVRALERPADGGRQLVQAMTRAGGFLRGQLARRLQMKHVPDLRFFWDESVDYARRIEEVLEEIRNEENRKEDEGIP